MKLKRTIFLEVPLRTDADGAIRIGTTDVTLGSLVVRYRVGKTPEAIHDEFPMVSVAEIYAVIAYYLPHCEELDQYVDHIETKAQN